MTHWLYLLQNHFNLIKVTVKDNSRLLRLFHLKVIMINMVGHHWWASCGQKKIAKINLCAPLLVTADSPYLVQLRWGEADEGSPRYCLFQICRQRYMWNLAFSDSPSSHWMFLASLAAAGVSPIHGMMITVHVWCQLTKPSSFSYMITRLRQPTFNKIPFLRIQYEHVWLI